MAIPIKISELPQYSGVTPTASYIVMDAFTGGTLTTFKILREDFIGVLSGWMVQMEHPEHQE